MSAPDAVWVAVTVRNADDHDAVSAALFEVGVDGVWEQADAVVTHVTTSMDLDALRHAVRAVAPEATIEIAPAPSIDWSTAWQAQLTARDVGDFVITPPWLAETVDPARALIIEPGMGFGTGDHPTTRGIMRLAAGVIRAGDHVADLGAGSAVLAIAAAKSGAARVWAIELDPPAIPNAEHNVQINAVADRVSVLEGDAHVLLPLVAPVRVIFANIISSVLVELFPVMRAALAPEGVVLVSGVLVSERAHLALVIEADGWRIDAEDVEGEWWSARLVAA
ncbi:MAG: 50S ribosomal protein L11 methyltransferase [Gemmatimonadaceae bacterium]|nr:50S ribosomal protein L11 methyltransferase [Gemmatimonadaceae bacterium]